MTTELRLTKEHMLMSRLPFFLMLVSLAPAPRLSAQNLEPAAPRPIALASSQLLPMTGTQRDFAISPDGTRVVYVSSVTGGTLMVRAIDQSDAVPLAGTAGARGPFISPDGKWVGFFTASELKRIPIAGGTSVSLCAISGNPRGASWGTDNTIVFAAGREFGLRAVSDAGGEPKGLTTPDTAHDEENHVLPSILPGGRSVLFTITSNRSVSDVAVLDLKTGQRKTLVKGGMQAEYVEPGYLVYAASGALHAVRFDAERLEVLGDSARVLESVFMRTNNLGAANYALSRQGTLVYVPGIQGAGMSSLVWLNRQGQEEPISAAPSRTYLGARISPDGSRVALGIRDQPYGIWILDLAQQRMTRLKEVASVNLSVWTPDGRRVIFSSNGPPGLFSQAVDKTADAEPLTITANLQVPTSFSPDGTRLIVNENTSTGRVMRLLRLDGDSKQTEPLTQTALSGTNGELSPDGRWLAYQSDESGENQIYVRPFPNVDSGRWQISSSGGHSPVWAKSRRELFYLDAAGAMNVVPVNITATFTAGVPKKLFDRDPVRAGGARGYDISPDGQRFLLIKGQTTAPTMVAAVNWSAELTARVPAR